MTAIEVLILIAIIVAFFLGQKAIQKLVYRVGAEQSIASSRIAYVEKTIVIAWFVIALIAAIAVTGKNFQDIGLLLGSSIAFFGIALFAQWSLLSNITASVIVFFFFPYRIGDWVEILDGDDSISGNMTEITLFHVVLKDAQGLTITYPNSLVFQKAVRITRPTQSVSETKNER